MSRRPSRHRAPWWSVCRWGVRHGNTWIDGIGMTAWYRVTGHEDFRPLNDAQLAGFRRSVTFPKPGEAPR